MKKMRMGFVLIASHKLVNRKFCLNSDLSQIRQYKSRDDHLKEINENSDYDVLIIGGGATGVGTLLSCSRRGLKTLLIEGNDFGSSSSSKSSKLFHGGLRYFERIFDPFTKTRKEDIELVKEGLNERDILLNNAAYMTEQVGMVVPATNIFRNLFNFCGVFLYYLYGEYWSKRVNFSIRINRPTFVWRDNMDEYFEGLDKKYKYGVVVFDGQFEESRMVMDSILTSTVLNHPELKKCNVLNYSVLKRFLKNDSGKIEGAVIYDKIKEKEMIIKCKVAINAGGVFGDEIRKLANERVMPLIQTSKGDHLSLGGKFIKNSRIGLFCPFTKDGRVIFILPWNGTVIIGTTEKPFEKPVIHPYPDSESSKEMLEVLYEYFPEADIKILSSWSGLRPLVSDPGIKETKNISRVHVIEREQESDLLSILGGKWTIFRKMGEEVVDSALEILKEKSVLSESDFDSKKKMSTKNMRFIGDERELIFNESISQTPCTRIDLINKIANKLSLIYLFESKVDIQRLVMNYGIRANDILYEMEINKEKREKLITGSPVSIAEVEHLIKAEMVEIPVDLLTRRLRTSVTDIDLAYKLLPKVVEIFGNIQKWDKPTIEQQKEFNLKLLQNLKFD